MRDKEENNDCDTFVLALASHIQGILIKPVVRVHHKIACPSLTKPIPSSPSSEIKRAPRESQDARNKMTITIDP